MLLLIFLFLLIKTTTAQIQITPIAKFYRGGHNISCHGAMDGRIDLVVVDGTGPYLFNWSNGSFNQNQQNLDTGVYTVVVTDVNGQTASATITLYQPNVLEVTLMPVVYEGGYHITAAGNNDGVIEAHVTGGTADYVYLWSNSTTQYKAGDLYAGPYTVTITDMNACTATASVVLTQPTPLQVVSITSPMHNGYNVSCKNGYDGAINLVVAGGVQSEPYKFHWSTGRETQNLSGIPAGNYSVRITDAAGASVVTQITLTEPPLFKISGMVPSLYPNGKNLSCNTCSNGSIAVNTTGGVGTPTYLWESGQTTQTISNQQAGNYFVTVTDLNGCTASSSKSLVAPERDDWSMFGNNGTNPNSQFMGTTDSVDFVFRTKNTERLRIKGNGILIVNGFSGTSTRLLRVDANGNVEPGDPVVSPGTISGLCDATSRLTLAWRKTNTLGPWNDYDLMNCSQRFGFGVWTPQERIHVNGFSRHSSSSASNYLNIGHDGNSKINSYGTDLFINHDSPQNVNVNTGAAQGDFSIGGNAFLATLSGKVGIRNSNPHDDIEIGNLFTLHNDGINSWIGYNSIFQSFNKRIVNGYASRITFGNQGDIFLGTAGIGLEIDEIVSWKGLKIDNEGKVGIGNSSPHDDIEIGNNFTLHNDDINSWIGKNYIYEAIPPGSNNYFDKRIVDGASSRIVFEENGSINIQTKPYDSGPLPFIWQSGLKINENGQVLIGNCIPSYGDYLLYVRTGIRTEKIRVDLAPGEWADYVFDKNYSLLPISKLEDFIINNGHLPGIPTAEEILVCGIDLGEFNAKLLAKVEELTLYIINMQKQIDILHETQSTQTK